MYLATSITPRIIVKSPVSKSITPDRRPPSRHFQKRHPFGNKTPMIREAEEYDELENDDFQW